MALPWTPEEELKGAQLLSQALQFSPSPSLAADLHSVFDEGDEDEEQSEDPLDDVSAVVQPQLPKTPHMSDTGSLKDASSSSAIDADFRQSGRFLCLDAGRRVEEGMELQSVNEGTSVTEGADDDSIDSENESEQENEEKENEEPNEPAVPASTPGEMDNLAEKESAVAKLAQFMQSTEAAAARAADAQARVQNFLANKGRHSVSAPTLTKPRTPVVLKRDKFHKVVKSSEELQLEASLLAHAEWKQKVQQNKLAMEREKEMKQRNVDKHERSRQQSKPKFTKKAWVPAKVSLPKKATKSSASAAAAPKKKNRKMAGVPVVQKRALTVPLEMGVLSHKGTGRKVESHAEREEREIAEAQQKLSAQIEANRRFSARASVCEGPVHSTRPLTTPVTPKCTSHPTIRKSLVPSTDSSGSSLSGHTSVQEMNKFMTNLRQQSSAELSQAMADARGKPRVTVPKAPSFATDSVARAKPSAASGAEEVKPFVARPMPDYASLSSVGINANAKARAPTVPKSPTSNSIARAKAAANTSSSTVDTAESADQSFVARPMPDYASLSKVGINTNVARRQLTEPKSPSFHAHSSARSSAPLRPRQEELDEAELAQQFKARPIGRQNMRASTGSIPHRPLTVPEPFNMPGEARQMHHRRVSTSEENDLAEIEAHQFKARPLNRAVFDGCGSSGVPQVKSRETTVAEPFRLRSPSASRSVPATEESAASPFKARPMPAFSENPGAAAKERRASLARPVSVPVSPNFPSKGVRSKSMSRAGNENDAPNDQQEFVARPMPDYASLSSVGINVNVKPRPLTVPKSPNVSASNRAAGADLYEDPDEAELAQQFKARPLPSHQTSYMRASTGSMPRPLTVPEPFNMPGESYQQQRKASVEGRRQYEAAAAAAEAERLTSFKAKPAPDWDTTCFIPKHSEKELTEFEEFDCVAGAGVEQHEQSLATKRAHKLAEEEDLLARAAAFVAKPLPPTTFEPGFVPHPSERPPLVPLVENVLAAGSQRAEQRKQYDELQKRRLAGEARQREELVKKREAQAEAEYQEQLDVPIDEGGMRFVPRPMPEHIMNGPDFVPGPSTAELTVPVTPTVLRHSGMFAKKQQQSPAKQQQNSPAKQKRGGGLMGTGPLRVAAN